MARNSEKPTPEAKALSLFLMAYKTINPVYKEKSKRINKRWGMVLDGDLDKADYLEEVNQMLEADGGYANVIDKTVKYYIDKTGEWTLKGTDKYCIDAQKIADQILKK